MHAMNQLQLDLPEHAATVITTAQAMARGVSSRELTRQVNAGRLARVGRGRYCLTESASSVQQRLANVAVMARKGTICLESALCFHAVPGIHSDGSSLSLAIGSKDRAPSLQPELIKLYRFSETALNEGREVCLVNDVEVSVTSVAKTVADCFKFRSKVGVGLAVHALKSSLASGMADLDEIMHYANICRVSNVMRPYVEALQ